MHYILRQKIKVSFFMCFVMLIMFKPITAEARLVKDVTIDTLADGYEVTIHFEFLIRYRSHTPLEASDYLWIEMRPVNFNRLESERTMLSWDRETGIPLKELLYEGEDPKHPKMTFVFTKKVEYEVRSSVDLRSLIVTVKTKVSPLPEEVKEDIPEEIEKEVFEEIEKGLPEEKEALEDEVERIPSEELVTIREDNLDKLMAEAKTAMIEHNYSRAVQIYTKILRTAGGDIKKQAQEYLGLARERNNQLAHAKSEYKKYLKEYPEGPDAERVRQRLAGLVTAAKKPKEQIVEVKRPKKIVEKPKWKMRYYGNVSQFFSRNQTFQEDGETQVNRNDLDTNLDLNSILASEGYDIRTKYTGSYQTGFMPDEATLGSLSALSIEIRHKKSGLYGKIGRQSRTSGGVLGRFDGTHISYDITPEIVINGTYGFPVESTKQMEVKTERKFIGVSADFGTFNEHWDYSVFFIDQGNSGVTDRRAIGGEVSYFDPEKSFFTLLDYDIFFKELNIFLFNGNWTLPSKTTLNLMFDYRRSPLFTTNNAIQGQGVEELDDLLDKFTDDELKTLAEDRSAISKSVTFGVTQELNDDVQLTGDFTISRLEGTVASGGVDAVPGTGNEYYCSMQLISNNVFFENDSIINGLRYSDTIRNNTYTYDFSARFPFTKKFRIVPKYRMDYRDKKGSDDKRLRLRPAMRMDYRFKKSVRFEVEGGVEWRNDYASGISSKSMEAFISAGYRINF